VFWTGWVELRDAVVDDSFEALPGPKAREMLVEEVKRRTGVGLSVGSASCGDVLPRILLGTRSSPGPAGEAFNVDSRSGPRDGYVIRTDEAGNVAVVGNDPRGMLFGVGKLLRILRYGKGEVSVASGLNIESHPDFAIRGHQLGYRPRSNTYDSWGIGEFEQYVRDLVVWGANSIELIPPIPSADILEGNGFKSKAWEMAKRMSSLLDSYDLDVYLWTPVDDRPLGGIAGGPRRVLCPSQPEDRATILESRKQLFSGLKRVDGVFIPGGDPGGCPCEKCTPWARTLIPLAKEIAIVLQASHPSAKVWISNQMFSKEENEYLYSYLEEVRPDWFGGLVYGPWTRETPEEVRERLPARYALRGYPDICHSVRCQYPVDDWDHSYALVEGRECPNPRPRNFAHIHNRYAHLFCGSITYSDGVNDDVNKVLWTALDWDQERPVEEILREYGNYFIEPGQGAAIARGILALEANWRGNPLEKEDVEETLRIWGRLEEDLPHRVRTSWRLQMLLFRAYLDAFVRRRLRVEVEAERRAMEILSEEEGEEALERALGVLGKRSEAPELRKRLEDLAEALYRSIGMKLGRRFGARRERADILDHLEEPLNNSEWLMQQIADLLTRGPEERRSGINEVLHWEDPVKGCSYDDLGNPSKQPHLVRRLGWEEDPGRLRSAGQEFDFARMKGGRLSWRRQAQALFGSPLEMSYEDLDPRARYKLRVTYGGYRHRATVRLEAHDGSEIHGPLELPQKSKQFEFGVPRSATEDGKLRLKWSLVEGRRGLAVAEVWVLTSV